MTARATCAATLGASAVVFTISCANGYPIGVLASAASFLIALVVLDT